MGVAKLETRNCLIYEGDCLTALQQLPLNTVDLTVTSPPYNIGKEYERVKPLRDYMEWSKDWMTAIHRITRARGAFWLNLGYVQVAGKGRAVPLPYLLWDMSPFFLQQEVVWNYGAGVASSKAFSPRNEKLLWFVKNPDEYTFNLDVVRDPNVKYPKQKKNGKLKCNSLGKNPTDVWQIPKVTSGANRSSRERTPHPAQFPMALVERVILACSNEGDLVLDPFMGSGSVAEVALRHNRAVLGMELNPSYFEIMAGRLRTKASPKVATRLQPSFQLDIT